MIGALVLRAVAFAQSPAGREVPLNPAHLKGDQYLADLSCARNGLCVVLWEFGVFSDADPPEFLNVRLAATTLAPIEGVLEERLFAEDPYATTPSAVASGRRFAFFWIKTKIEAPQLPSASVCQWYDTNLVPQSEVIELAETGEGQRGLRDTVSIPGGFVQLFSGWDISPPDSSEGAFLSFVDLAGHELRAPVRVNPEALGDQTAHRGGLAVDPTAGIVTAVYSQHMPSEDPESDIFYRRFSLAGEPLTPDVRVNSYLPDWQFHPAVANAPNGDFVVVWTSKGQDGSYAGIFGQRFTRQGLPIGPEFQVNQETFSDQIFAQVATDAAGNFVVVWESYDPSRYGLIAWDIKARLYRAAGSPVGPEVFVNRHRENYQEFPLVAFPPNGTFVVAWNSYAQVPPANDNLNDVFARRFSASPGDEPCLVGNGRFWCDTGRTGGDLEVRHGFGGASSGPGFLGDVDGDGRADPCVYTGGTFRCDTDHEGGAAEVQIPFAFQGATVPLLGDVDSDGRADPCLAGKNGFFCDTRHDGGQAEMRISFGQAGETLLLGDVNGDGLAEACAFAGGLFRCDTGHDGGQAETVVRFGRRGDQALLGDFDGDGRDDPCVFRPGQLLCDTKHDGGTAEGTLSLGAAGDRVVLGNLDGL
jgi:hypothetical protein